MAERVALILPALDEAESLGAVLPALAGAGLAQIIVADNGSRDRTAEVARAHGAQVVAEPRRGYGQACLAGIAALAPEISVVAFMDADGSHDPSELVALTQPIARGEADFVIGTRAARLREPGAMTPQQLFGNWLATRLMRLLFGVRYSDLGPFRAIRRDALAQLGMCDADFGWTVEMQIKAHRAGLRVAEVPVHCRRRRRGRSKISGTLRGTLLAGIKIIWTILRYRMTRRQQTK
jgi:glycosyltransferase involved in cell wall biosynthesis